MTNEKRKQGKVAAEAAVANKDKGVTRKRLVAVYGTLMAGERNAMWRIGIKTMTEGFVWGRLFDTGYGFPALVPADHDDRKASQVRVEVMECTQEQVENMDILEGYPRLYRREEVKCECDDGAIRSVTIYVMNNLPTTATEIVTQDIKHYGTIADWREYRKANGW